MSNELLLDDSPRIFLPKLAQKYGVEDATFLQQLHYLTRNGGVVEEDGERWISATVQELRERWFFYMSKRTLERVISDQKKTGALVVKRKRIGCLYRVDALMIRQSGGSDPSENRQIGGSGPANLAGPRVEKDEGKEELQTPQADSASQLFETGDEAPAAPESTAPDFAALVWERWEATFPGKTRLGLTDARRRDLTKAGKAIDGDLDIAYRAIAGFASWLSKGERGRPDITRVFATGMNDKKNLTDKIVGWADDAPASIEHPDVSIPPAWRHRVTEKKNVVREWQVRHVLRPPVSSHYEEQGLQAAAFLEDHFGITYETNDQGIVTFSDATRMPEV